mgnify:CR=1 FL=1
MTGSPVTSDRVDVVGETKRAQVLLHPTRLAILEALEAPGSASKLAKRLDASRQRLNYHLRELAVLVERLATDKTYPTFFGPEGSNE